jgi:glycosyltransferase involved in cell wall biosynthesis
VSAALPEVAYLHPHFTVEGGAGRVVLETGVRLARRGVRVSVLTIRAEDAIVGEYREAIRFIELGGPLSSELLFWLRLPALQRKVSRALDALPDAVVFPQVFPSNWWGMAYKAWRPQRRVVWLCNEPSAFLHTKEWIHAVPPGSVKAAGKLLGPALRALDVWLMRRADHVLANSEWTRDYAERVYRFPEGRVSTVHLGVDLSTFAPRGGSRDRRFVCVGRLTRFKNVDVVVRAMDRLRARGHQGLRLDVVGKGEEEQDLAGLVRELGLGSQVVMRGALTKEELVDTLQASRGLVLASVDEPFGLVPVEAMACGTPAIVTGSGGPAETVAHGVSGTVLPPGRPSPEALADAMEGLLDDACFRRLSAGAVGRAAAFSIDRTTDLIRAHLFPEKPDAAATSGGKTP